MHRADGQARGDLLISDTGATGFQRLALGTQGNVLKAGANDPEWGVDPASDLITTAGDLLYGSAADTLARLALGSQNAALIAGASAPAWSSNVLIDDANSKITFGGDTEIYRFANGFLSIASGDNLRMDSGSIFLASGQIDFTEVSDPSAQANRALLYARDDGAGTTQLTAVFPSGDIQVIAEDGGVDPVSDLVTTAGDTLYATGADTLTRLGIGTAGQVLSVNSGATAPEWADAGGGMKKTSGTGYFLIPAGPTIGTTVTSSATADTYGSWTELIASTSAALFVVGVVVRWGNVQNSYSQIQIGTGAGGAETDIATVKLVGLTTTAGDRVGDNMVELPFPVPVATSTRIAARVADAQASALGHDITLVCINQADLADI